MPRRIEVTLVELETGDAALDYEGRRKRIDGDNRGLVALHDGAPVGYLIFHAADGRSERSDGPVVHLYSAWVTPEARRRGVFAQMGGYLKARYPGYRMHGYPVDDHGAVRRFLKRSAREDAAVKTPAS